MDALGFGTDARLHGEDPPVAVARPDPAEPPARVPTPRPRSSFPSAGAGFVVVLCGDMQRMPGLGPDAGVPKVDIDDEGRTVGLF